MVPRCKFSLGAVHLFAAGGPKDWGTDAWQQWGSHLKFGKGAEKKPAGSPHSHLLNAEIYKCCGVCWRPKWRGGHPNHGLQAKAKEPGELARLILRWQVGTRNPQILPSRPISGSLKTVGCLLHDLQTGPKKVGKRSAWKGLVQQPSEVHPGEPRLQVQLVARCWLIGVESGRWVQSVNLGTVRVTMLDPNKWQLSIGFLN